MPIYWTRYTHLHLIRRFACFLLFFLRSQQSSPKSRAVISPATPLAPPCRVALYSFFLCLLRRALPLQGVVHAMGQPHSIDLAAVPEAKLAPGTYDVRVDHGRRTRTGKPFPNLQTAFFSSVAVSWVWWPAGDMQRATCSYSTRHETRRLI